MIGIHLRYFNLQYTVLCLVSVGIPIHVLALTTEPTFRKQNETK